MKQLLFIFLTSILIGCNENKSFDEENNSVSEKSIENLNINKVFNSYNDGINYAIKVKKPILLEFTGYGVVNGRKMENHVFTDSTIKKIMSNDFVFISLCVDDTKELPIEQQIETTYEMNDGSVRKSKITTIGNKWASLQSTIFKTNFQPYYVILDCDENQLIESASYKSHGSINSFKNWLSNGLDKFNNKGVIYKSRVINTNSNKIGVKEKINQSDSKLDLTLKNKQKKTFSQVTHYRNDTAIGDEFSKISATINGEFFYYQFVTTDQKGTVIRKREKYHRIVEIIEDKCFFVDEVLKKYKNLGEVYFITNNRNREDLKLPYEPCVLPVYILNKDKKILYECMKDHVSKFTESEKPLNKIDWGSF